MSSPRSVVELLRVIEPSQLIDASLLRSIKPELLGSANGQQPVPSAAKVLVKKKLVTPYQARQLLKGRHRGFYIGKNKILDLLGTGGMGKVFLAEQITMQRMVAVKLITPRKGQQQQSEAVARFTREARSVASLSHPNIVQAVDFDCDDGFPFIVMEYIDVAAQVERFGPLSVSQAADYICQAAAGLGHAHQNGFVHRDVKPGNFLVDPRGRLKVLDLGFGRA